MRSFGIDALTDSSAAFARFAASIRYEELPDGIRSLAKLLLLDSLGTAIAASGISECSEPVLRHAVSHFGHGLSPILGFGVPASPLGASFANGALVHALNYDAIGAGHVGIVMPAILAASDVDGNVTGGDLLAGVVVGAEITARLAAAVADQEVKHPSTLGGQLLTYFGCTAGAARILNMTEGQVYDAIGIALMQAAGTTQIVVEGDKSGKAAYGAFPNFAGLHAALLARAGLAAGCDAFEGRAGLFAQFFGGSYEVDALQCGLGAQYRMRNLQFKKWPTSGVLFPFIIAAIRLGRTAASALDGVESIRIVANPSLRPWVEPASVRRVPENSAAAANSGQFVIARALVYGEVTLQSFTKSGLEDRVVRSVSERVHVEFATSMSAAQSIALVMKSGTVHEAAVGQDGDDLDLKMSPQALRDKFRDCASFGARSMGREQADELCDLVERLDGSSRLGGLKGLLTTPRREGDPSFTLKPGQS